MVGTSRRGCVPVASVVAVMRTTRRFASADRRVGGCPVLYTGSSILSAAWGLGLGESVVGRWVKFECDWR